MPRAATNYYQQGEGAHLDHSESENPGIVVDAVRSELDSIVRGKFTVGDKIISNPKTPNTPIKKGRVALVVTLCTAAALRLMTSEVVMASSWDEYYPGWHTRPIYYVLLDTPSKLSSALETKEPFVLFPEDAIEAFSLDGIEELFADN